MEKQCGSYRFIVNSKLANVTFAQMTRINWKNYQYRKVLIKGFLQIIQTFWIDRPLKLVNFGLLALI